MRAAISAGTQVVAIVGRPNVGKSAFFNRIIGGRPAIVEDLPGTTRDRIYGDADWRGRNFRVIDTGGIEPDDAGTYAALVREQVAHAMREAAIILFLVDAKDGITAADREVADLLRRADRPVLLIANKAESQERQESAVQFYELGFGEPLAVSSLHGLGVAEVLDEIVELLPEGGVEAAFDAALPIAIIGRPNVGKSALLNAILGEERVIVSSVPGTTRDAIDTPFTFEGRDLVLIDTAGLRRRGRIERGVEKHAAMRSQRALARAQVALCVFDLAEGFTAQDTHVAGYAIEEVRGLIIVANKWDLVRERDWTEEHWTHFLRGRLRFAPWASIRFTSAAEGEGIDSVLAESVRIGEERKRRVETALLNQTIRRAVASKPPPAPSKGGRVKLLYVTQAAIEPPTFVFFLNDASLAHFGYRRYMENVIRRNFGFEGTAIALTFRSRSEEM